MGLMDDIAELGRDVDRMLSGHWDLSDVTVRDTFRAVVSILEKLATRVEVLEREASEAAEDPVGPVGVCTQLRTTMGIPARCGATVLRATSGDVVCMHGHKNGPYR